MACETYRELIDKYVEGLVTLDEKEALEEHIKICAECRSEVEDIGRILRAFNSFESVDLPDDFMPSLHERLLKLKGEQKSTGITSFFPGSIRYFMASFHSFYRSYFKILAGGFCVILISFFLGRFSNMPEGLFGRKGMGTEKQLAKIESKALSLEAAHADGISKAESSGDDKIQPITGDSADKKILMADKPKEGAPSATVEKESMLRSEFEISNPKQRSIAVNKSSRNGSIGDVMQTENGIKYKALQDGGQKAAAANPGSEGPVEQITIFVNDFDKNVGSAIELADQLGGSIRESQITAEGGENLRKAYILMELPAENLATVLERIKALSDTGKSLEGPQDKSAAEEKAVQPEEQLMMAQSHGQEGQQGNTVPDEKTTEKETQSKEKKLVVIQVNIMEKEAVQRPKD
ncbi:MAG TPA: hypothetical protein GXX35_09900 [Thermoanaerobacterales bacterium]|nr:hypothetical protein [Thermoanaerobacterales bacterium]